MRGLTEKVEPARSPPQSAVDPMSGGRSQVGSRNAPMFADLEHDTSAAGGVPAASRHRPCRRRVDPRHKRSHANVRRPCRIRRCLDQRATRVPILRPASDAVLVAPADRPDGSLGARAVGASHGRTVQFVGDQLTVGRVGVQVAVVRRVADGYRLIPLEGSVPPRINGAPVASEGSPLHPGDTFEVAGVRLELSVNS